MPNNKKSGNRGLKKFKVWTHIDTGVSQEVWAEDEDAACDKAKALAMDPKEYARQLAANAQAGESNVV